MRGKFSENSLHAKTFAGKCWEFLADTGSLATAHTTIAVCLQPRIALAQVSVANRAAIR